MANVEAGLKALQLMAKGGNQGLESVVTINDLVDMLEAMREPSRKRTIEIDREVAEGWLKDKVSTGSFGTEIRRALEAK